MCLTPKIIDSVRKYRNFGTRTGIDFFRRFAELRGFWQILGHPRDKCKSAEKKFLPIGKYLGLWENKWSLCGFRRNAACYLVQTKSLHWLYLLVCLFLWKIIFRFYTPRTFLFTLYYNLPVQHSSFLQNLSILLQIYPFYFCVVTS